MIDHKISFLLKLFDEFNSTNNIKVVDMGSGTSKDWIAVLKKYEHIEYTGIEFNKESILKAKDNLSFSDKVRFINEFGEFGENKLNEEFDVVISLSVLEHVKYLNPFLQSSIRMLKKGGHLIHRYDLGHSLYPSSFSERIKVQICKSIPGLISSTSFTTHPSKHSIVDYLSENGIENIKIEQNQTPLFKTLINKLKHLDGKDDLIHEMIEFERKLYSESKIVMIDKAIDKYFPSITISGTKILN
ncbi:MAG TPA: class I SAM-dependent methyltransferase [Saprospiraceae bacterium]|nr:class I SAM-dependent methyltransferase [Saprospiraceae bacterium]